MGNLGLTVFLSTLALCSSTAENTGDSEVIGSRKPVRAVVGHDVVLPCQLQPPSDVTGLTVEWACNSTNVHVYRNMNDDPDNQNEKFKNRTSLFRDNMSRGKMSLKLTNVTYTDAGNYICYVPSLQSQVKMGNVTLIVDPVDNKNSSMEVDSPSTGEELDNKLLLVYY